MAYSNSGRAHYDAWSQQSQAGQSSGTYRSTGYSNRNQTYSQPGPELAYASQTQQHGRSGSFQYPYGSQGTYPTLQAQVASTVVSPVSNYSGGHRPSPYDHSAHYSQQSSAWSYPQHGQTVAQSERMHSLDSVASPVEYGGAHLPFAPRMHADSDARYVSPESWAASTSSMPEFQGSHQVAAGRSTNGSAEPVVPCPYECGTVLTGVHAVGNMTRHLKSQNCIGSGKDKTRHVCPMPGCEKRYIRSDGLRVHLRKRHNISHASERNGSSEYEEGVYR